jgi:hypothetical protein
MPTGFVVAVTDTIDLLRTLAREPAQGIPGGRQTCPICGKSILRGLYPKHDCEPEPEKAEDNPEPVAIVEKYTGSLMDMAIIIWTGEQPPVGTKLYTHPPKAEPAPEPVAWLAYDGSHRLFIVRGDGPHDIFGGFPVYTQSGTQS